MNKNANTPLFISYDVSYPCNYRCVYCRNDWEDKKNCGFPELKVVASIIDKIASAGANRIIYTGGEFFLLPFWKDVLEYGLKKGLHNWIITNGALIEPKEIEYLEERVERINISFHAPNQDMYSEIMGINDKSLFRKVVENLRLIGMSQVELGIFYSPIKLNYRYFYDTISRLADWGVEIVDVNLNRILPMKHTLEKAGNMTSLNLFEHKRLVEQLLDINEKLEIDAYAEAYPVCFLNKFIDDKALIRRINRPCLLGGKAIAMNSDGGLKLCPAHGFIIPSGDRSLQDEWTDNKALGDFAGARWRNVACKECEHWEYCLGGCHASRGKIYSDDVLIIDDEVIFEKGIDRELFHMLVGLYQPFLNKSYLNASVQYTVFSKYKHDYPIGVIAINKSKRNARFVEIAIIPQLQSKYYSFLMMQKLMQLHPLDKYGWTSHKANLPSIKLLEKQDGGFFEKTVQNQKRIEAEGFFRSRGSATTKMREALFALLPQSQVKFKKWSEEFVTRNAEVGALDNYLDSRQIPVIDAHYHIHKKEWFGTNRTKNDFHVLKFNFESDEDILLANMREAGIEKTVVFPLASTFIDLDMANQFVIDMSKKSGLSGRIIPFAVIDEKPDHWVEQGVMGFKEHVYGQRIQKNIFGRDIFSQKFKETYKYMELRRLPLLLHAGVNRIERIRNDLLKETPELIIILAHLGADYPVEHQYCPQLEQISHALGQLREYPNVFYDLSTITDRKILLTALDLVGSYKIFFGSDYPNERPAYTLRRIKSLGLSRSDMEKILYQNITKILKNIENG